MPSSHAVDSTLAPERSNPDIRQQFEHRPTVSIHDLNNKLGIIFARCALIASRPGLDPKIARDLQAIYDAAEVMSNMLGRDACTVDAISITVSQEKQ
jgi:hypothetical protein